MIKKDKLTIKVEKETLKTFMKEIPSILYSDKKYNDFLTKIKSTPNSMLIFLIRQDGGSSYNVAAGLAQSKYEILTGKLPIPEAGEIDLGLFEK